MLAVGAFIHGCLSFRVPFRVFSMFATACTCQRGQIVNSNIKLLNQIMIHIFSESFTCL